MREKNVSHTVYVICFANAGKSLLLAQTVHHINVAKHTMFSFFEWASCVIPVLVTLKIFGLFLWYICPSSIINFFFQGSLTLEFSSTSSTMLISYSTSSAHSICTDRFYCQVSCAHCSSTYVQSESLECIFTSNYEQTTDVQVNSSGEQTTYTR